MITVPQKITIANEYGLEIDVIATYSLNDQNRFELHIDTPNLAEDENGPLLDIFLNDSKVTQYK